MKVRPYYWTPNYKLELAQISKADQSGVCCKICGHPWMYLHCQPSKVGSRHGCNRSLTDKAIRPPRFYFSSNPSLLHILQFGHNDFCWRHCRDQLLQIITSQPHNPLPIMPTWRWHSAQLIKNPCALNPLGEKMRRVTNWPIRWPQVRERFSQKGNPRGGPRVCANINALPCPSLQKLSSLEYYQ